MAKDVIKVNGEDTVVREDTAKAFRGVNWALISIGAFIVMAAVLAIIFLVSGSRDGRIESPSQIENTERR